MKGWKKTTVRGKSPARKKQRAHGDHSVHKAKQSTAQKQSKVAWALVATRFKAWAASGA